MSSAGWVVLNNQHVEGVVMTVYKNGKPVPKVEPDRLILEAFSTSEDFEERLSEVTKPGMPGPRSDEAPLVFERPFSEDVIDNLVGPAKAPVPDAVKPEVRAGEVGIDPEHAQYQFYVKRLQDKQNEYPEDTEENALKQSANVILYILEEFDYPVEEEKRAKIIRRMRRILGMPRVEYMAARPREPFRSQRLREKVDALYKRHMRRYALHRMEIKKQQALEEERKRQLSEAEQRAKAEQKRLEKEKRRAQPAISEEKLRQLEEEFDAMMALTASNYGISTAKLMTFGYEEAEETAGSPPVLPAVKSNMAASGKRGPKSNASVMPAGKMSGHSKMPRSPKSMASVMPAAKPAEERKGFLTPEEILRRNMERRRQRGLLDDKK